MRRRARATRATVDPLRQFNHWGRRAARAGTPLPEAMALATASGRGVPAVRMVLLKLVDERGFVFFTDARSPKGRDLRATGRAAMAIYWDRISRQVRVEGRVRPVSTAEADAYWQTRPRASRLAASVSTQSAPLASRAVLLARWQALARRRRGKDIPRPAYWTGFRIVPSSIEFWSHRAHRLNHRELFVRARGRWVRRLLQP